MVVNGEKCPEKGVDPTLKASLYTSLMYYCYVIENELGELYFGSTDNLKRRLGEHQAGKSFATKGHDWALIYYEAYRTEHDARLREQSIKHNGGTKKQLKNRITHSRR